MANILSRWDCTIMYILYCCTLYCYTLTTKILKYIVLLVCTTQNERPFGIQGIHDEGWGEALHTAERHLQEFPAQQWVLDYVFLTFGSDLVCHFTARSPEIALQSFTFEHVELGHDQFKGKTTCTDESILAWFNFLPWQAPRFRLDWMLTPTTKRYVANCIWRKLRLNKQHYRWVIEIMAENYVLQKPERQS